LIDDNQNPPYSPFTKGGITPPFGFFFLPEAGKGRVGGILRTKS